MRSSLSLQRLLFAHQKKQVASLVQPASRPFRAYERRYQRATRGYRSVIGLKDVITRAQASDIIYVGDYHTYRPAQHTFAELVEASLSAERRVVLALEFVEGAKQKTLDAYLAGRLSERTFLKRIAHPYRGGFEIWPGFRRILELAKRHRLEVVAIDRRAGGSQSLERRDRYAAARIAQAAKAPDGPRVFVLMGQFHVIPGHLPRRVAEALGESRRSSFVIYQNAEGVWWKLARRGLAGSARAVELDEHSACVLTASPVVCQRSFLDYVEAEAGDAPLEASGLTKTFRLLSKNIGRLIGLPVGREIEAIEVVTASELDVMDRIARRGRFSGAELARLERALLSKGSALVPRARMVWLAGLSLSHAAEEAARFVRWVALGSPAEPVRGRADAFWASCYDEALGFFGSRLVNPARRSASLEEWVRQYEDRASPGHRAAAYVLATYAWAVTGAQQGRPLLPTAAALRARVCQGLGHLVGDALAQSFIDTRATRPFVRALFTQPLLTPATQFSLLAQKVLGPQPRQGYAAMTN